MEPFEVMISESAGADAGDRPAGAARRRSRRSARAGACPAASSGGSPATATSSSSRAGSTPTEARAPAPRSSPGSRRAPSRRDAIVHERLAAPPERRRARARARRARSSPATGCPERGMDPGAVLLALLGSPNLASRRAVFEQYDSTVRRDTVAGPGHGAAVLRVKGTTKALVAATDGNAGVSAVDPWLGAAMSVAEATRNVAITGARPLGVTNCLNYGDPTRPDAFWQLSEGVRGLGDACRALGLPVTGGNVSLYNESRARPDRADARRSASSGCSTTSSARSGRRSVADRRRDRPRRRGRARPRRQRVRRGSRAPLPRTARRRSTSSCERRAPGVRPGGRGRAGLLASAQDVSGGGFAVALAEAAMWGERRRRVRLPVVELAGRRPVRREPEPRRRRRRRAPRRRRSSALARQHGLPVEAIGTVGGDRLVVELAGAGATGAAEERGSRRRRRASTSRSRTCAVPGSTACRVPSAGTPDARQGA